MRTTIGIYGMVPIKLCQDDRLKKVDFQVYCSLASFQGMGEGCWPSIKTIGERAGISRHKTIAESLARLESCEWIARKARYDKNGMQKSNYYVCMFDVNDAETEAGGGAESAPHKRTIENDYINTNSPNYIDASSDKEIEIINNTLSGSAAKLETELKITVEKTFTENGAEFVNWPKERTAVKAIVKNAMKKANPKEYLFRLIQEFYNLTQSTDRFWREQPFLPSTLNSSGIYPRVLTKIKNYDILQKQAEDNLKYFRDR